MGMPRTDAQRIEMYNAKYSPTTVGLKIAARLAGMKTTFAGFANAYTTIQLQVQARLALVGTIFPAQYGAYYAFAGELYHLALVTGQPALDATAQLVGNKWSARGLDEPTLVDIAAEVFGITIVFAP